MYRLIYYKKIDVSCLHSERAPVGRTRPGLDPGHPLTAHPEGDPEADPDAHQEGGHDPCPT